MELNKVLSKVQKLIALAEHENTGTDEANAARDQADALMLKYAIDEALLEMARPASERMKPATIDIQLTSDHELLYEMVDLASVIARFCRCRVRHYSRYNSEEHCYMSKVYGFESDLRYFEFLYTTLRLHMIGALRPKPDASLSAEENAYRFHEAGFNWLEIAQAYGWRKATSLDWYDRRDLGLDDDAEYWYNKNQDPREYKTNWQLGSSFKRAYQRACKVRGEATKVIPAGASTNFRKDAARGYTARISRRLREQEQARTGIGTALALRMDDLEDYIREENAHLYTRCPECKKLSDSKYTCDRCGFVMEEMPEAERCQACAKAKSGYCNGHRPRSYKTRYTNMAGWEAGVRTANTADLSRSAGDSTKKSIG